MNKYTCSNGERVSQATIDRRRSETYRRIYVMGWGFPCGCGVAAQGTAHLVPQARCKQIGRTEYCWLEINMVPACHQCNQKIENISTVVPEDWFYDELLRVTEIIDPERYLKLTL